MMKFGDYLRERREAKAWTQPDAAAKAEIEQSYLSKLETGKSYPSEEVYARLVKTFEIDNADMSRRVDAAELDKLKEIKDVRAAVLDRKKSHRTITRAWLVAGLCFLMIGGASLGFVGMNASLDTYEFRYRSLGALTPGENLNEFDIVAQDISASDPNYEALRSKQQTMITRINEIYHVTTEFRGESFIDDAPDGRRRYQLYDTRIASDNSPLRWFYIPAFMFMAGSFGCFFIAYRWR